MPTYNPKNERIKRDYFAYQTEANHKSESTVAGICRAILYFEDYTGFKDFATFNKEQAIAFKKRLAAKKSQHTGDFISKATMLTTVSSLKDFFGWLAWQPGYKSRIHVPDIDYFNLADKEISIAKANKFQNFPTLEQIRKVIFSMPSDTDIQRRNRALIALTILTGMRDSAIASLRLKHIDLGCDPILVRQEPDQVKTKFSKQILSYFVPIGEDIKAIVVDWIRELREGKLYSQSDPVFPRTRLAHDGNQTFIVRGLDAVCWSTTTPIRKIFREAFESCGLPYFHPHLFRQTLVHLGEQVCGTPEDFKAWSQNLGHESPLTTFTSYGNLDPYRQGEIIKRLAKSETSNDLAEKIAEMMRKSGYVPRG